MRTLARHPLLQGPLQAIALAAGDVGATQIRNSATIGGNLANASPAGDLIPVLSLLEAEAVIAGPCGGVRRQAVQELLLGPGRTTLAHNEALIRLLVPLPASPTCRSAFAKLGFRNAMSISRIGLALLVDRDDGGTITLIRIVAGAISLKPIRLEAAEQALLHRKFDDEAVTIVGNCLSDLIMEVTPKHFDRDYKVAAAMGVAQDACRVLQQ